MDTFAQGIVVRKDERGFRVVCPGSPLEQTVIYVDEKWMNGAGLGDRVDMIYGTVWEVVRIERDDWH